MLGGPWCRPVRSPAPSPRLKAPDRVGDGWQLTAHRGCRLAHEWRTAAFSAKQLLLARAKALAMRTSPLNGKTANTIKIKRFEV